MALAPVLLGAGLSAEADSSGASCTPSEWADPPRISIDGVSVRDHHLLPLDTQDPDRFQMATDADAVLAQLLQAQEYRPCLLDTNVLQTVRGFYEWYGYLQAHIDISTTAAGRDAVDVVAQVEEGPQYRLGGIYFRGTTVFLPDELRSLFPLQAGAVYDARQIDRSLYVLRLLYGARGFLNAEAVAETVLDDANGRVDLVIDIEEGPSTTPSAPSESTAAITDANRQPLM